MSVSSRIEYSSGPELRGEEPETGAAPVRSQQRGPAGPGESLPGGDRHEHGRL